MRVTVAMDSFKGSLSSTEAGNAVKEGILEAYPDAQVYVCPMADGGEGTVNALTEGLGGTFRSVTVTGPVGRPVISTYGMIGDMDTAVIEVSSACGITKVPDGHKDILHSTTYGVGETILDAIHNGCRNFIIGLGGSATNDCGIGMLNALGFVFTDEYGNEVTPDPMGLSTVRHISADKAVPELKKCCFRVACDVTNPLYGENGASRVFAPQKGATEKEISQMDGWMKNFSSLVTDIYPSSDPSYPGSGAAGGLGYAFRTFLGAELSGGARIVMELTRMEEYMKISDMVITGEGKLDGQTVMGKAPIMIAKTAKKYDLPVIALSGIVADGAEIVNSEGIDSFFPIIRITMSAQEAMERHTASENLRSAANQVMRLIKAFQ